jgi:hypothetical protein
MRVHYIYYVCLLCIASQCLAEFFPSSNIDTTFSEEEQELIMQSPSGSLAYIPDNVRELLAQLHRSHDSLWHNVNSGMHIAYTHELLAAIPNALYALEQHKNNINHSDYQEASSLLVDYYHSLQSNEASLFLQEDTIRSACKVFCNLFVRCGITAKTLAIASNAAIGGDLTVHDNVAIGGDLTVNGAINNTEGGNLIVDSLIVGPPNGPCENVVLRVNGSEELTGFINLLTAPSNPVTHCGEITQEVPGASPVRIISTSAQSEDFTNIFVGNNSGPSAPPTGNPGNNSSLGANSLENLSEGVNNTVVGASAGTILTNGLNNIIIGAGANTSAINDTNDVIIGTGAEATETNQIRIGYTSPANTSVNTSTFIDGIVGQPTPAAALTAVGITAAGQLGTNATTFSIPGTIILDGPVTIGTGPCSTTVLTVNGSESINGNIDLTTNPSTAVCGNILKSGNRFIHNFSASPTDFTNVFVGQAAGNFGVTYINGRNTALGNNALTNLISGTANTAIGFNTLPNIINGSSNLAFGANGGSALGAGDSTNILIGSAGVAGDSSNIRIGTVGAHLRCFISGIVGQPVPAAPLTAVGITAAGQLGTNATAFTFPAPIAGPLTIGTGPCSSTVLTVNGSQTINGNITLSTDPSTATCGTIRKGVNVLLHNYSPFADFSNLYVGEASGNYGNTTGNPGRNTCLGTSCLTSLTSGTSNTAIGFNALPNITTGSFNFAFGDSGGLNLTINDSFNILIGSAGVTGDNNTARIGTNGVLLRCFIAGIRGVTTGIADAIPVLIDSAGQLGTISSSRRYKENIQSILNINEPFMQLNPVQFTYKSDTSKKQQYGLIAEEVEKAFPELVVYNKDGQPETVQYHLLNALLIKMIQNQQCTIADLQSRVEELEKQIKNLL